MVTIGEQQMWHNIEAIARSLNRIANCAEAAEKRARMTDPSFDRSGPCQHPGCDEPVIVMINGQLWCIQHIDAGFQQIRDTIDALEKAGVIPTPKGMQ